MSQADRDLEGFLDGRLGICYAFREGWTDAVGYLCTCSIGHRCSGSAPATLNFMLVQSDDAAREAAQKVLEEELKRQTEEQMQNCEREK